MLLHGGFTDSRSFEGNLAGLADRFRLFLPDRRGHGRTADVEGPLTLDVLAQDTIEFLEKVVSQPARLVGFSAGAIVALFVAMQRPELLDRLVLVSGLFHRDAWILAPASDGELPPGLVSAYGEVSPDGVDHIEIVRTKIVESATVEPALSFEELSNVKCRTLVMAGDDDLVTLEHTLSLYRGLPNSELAIVPGTSHTLLLEKPALCTGMIADFLGTEPVLTMTPIRRATRTVQR